MIRLIARWFGSRRGWIFFAVWIVFGAASAAVAITAPPGQSDDIRRFGLDQPEPARPGHPVSRQSTVRFKARAAGAVRFLYDSQGRLAGVSGRLTGARAGVPEAVAADFLKGNTDVLGIDPAGLRLVQSRHVSGVWHLLYEQTVQGFPVEFSRIKVHVADSGEVRGIHSNYIQRKAPSAIPTIFPAQAAAAVVRDLGQGPSGPGALVYLPMYKTGELRLAWKFRVGGRQALWLYYIDAKSGEVLFRYNDLHYLCPNGSLGTGGTVSGRIYPIDPNTSGPAIPAPMPNDTVYVYTNSVSTYATTDANGNFCNPNSGAIYAGLQGPYANVANYNASAAHYDNGNGVWFTAQTPVVSPNPYSNVNGSNPIVFTSVVQSPNPPSNLAGASQVVKAMPVFSLFQVGTFPVDSFTGSGFIAVDDQGEILDGNGNRVGAYVGNKTTFNGAAVSGLKPSYTVDIDVNSGGQEAGFTINVSSFLVLTAPAGIGGSSFQWTSTMTADGSLDEINAFYHINKMHDYYLSDIDASSAAAISQPALVMVHAGPSLYNAFYNPAFDNLFFGDGNNGSAPFALDATVIHHEYTHWVVHRIYPIINFGQFGALSEAMADYFSASSLNAPNIGAGLRGIFSSSEGALRALQCNPGTQIPACKTFPADWQGEIHSDSLMLSQALWDIRSDIGQACTDELVFQSLFYFPSSFQEFLDSMLQADQNVSLQAPGFGKCGAVNGAHTTNIINHFAFHGITVGPTDPNSGIETALDISTMGAITATLYPAAALNYYAFGAAPGMIHASLKLPSSGTGAYYAYGMQLLDRNLETVVQAYPTIDINPTVNNACPDSSNPASFCQTSNSGVDLFYNNPSSNQFYLMVSAAPNDFGDNSATNSQSPYTLSVSYSKVGILSSSIVTASFDNDIINFSVAVSSFQRQNYNFSYAQLRDQSQNVLLNTATNGLSPLLTVVAGSTVNANGLITGKVKLVPGFATRFPSVGTAYLEVFGINQLQAASCAASTSTCIAQSLGFSNPLNLTANMNSLSAWNNVFNPLQGQRATFKYQIQQPGHVTLRLYTLDGRLVSTLVNQDMPAGEGSVDWAGVNGSGRTVASGVYLLNMVGPGIHATQKVIVVK